MAGLEDTLITDFCVRGVAMVEPILKLHADSERATALAHVLEQNTTVKELMQECAGELSEVNSNMKLALDRPDPLPRVKNALLRNENVEALVNGVSRKLEAVNEAIKSQVRDRRLLDHQFAAAIEQEGAARKEALHDVLTGLPNRALFADRLEHGLAQSQRHHWAMAVMFIDLDNFKNINDVYGHGAGDHVLRTIADRLIATTRSDDTISRYGGDEFLYLLTEIHDEAQVRIFAEKLVRTIQAPCSIGERDATVHVEVNASIGISLFPEDGVAPQILVEKADAAMYRAKQSCSGIAFAE
jgi:diguanylate cyclase (GGDEF)-like protein